MKNEIKEILRLACRWYVQSFSSFPRTRESSRLRGVVKGVYGD